jgi:hypothetical protein
VLPQVEQKLSSIMKELQHLPKGMTKDEVAEYVRRQLDQLSWSLREATLSNEMGGAAEAYNTVFKSLYTELGR